MMLRLSTNYYHEYSRILNIHYVHFHEFTDAINGSRYASRKRVTLVCCSCKSTPLAPCVTFNSDLSKGESCQVEYSSNGSSKLFPIFEVYLLNYIVNPDNT